MAELPDLRDRDHLSPLDCCTGSGSKNASTKRVILPEPMSSIASGVLQSDPSPIRNSTSQFLDTGANNFPFDLACFDYSMGFPFMNLIDIYRNSLAVLFDCIYVHFTHYLR